MKSPYSIFTHNDTVFVNELSSNYVHKFSTKTNEFYNRWTSTKFILGYQLLVYNNKYYFHNNGSFSYHYIYTSNNEEFYKVPKGISHLGGSPPVKNYFILKDKIYFMNNFEIFIHTYDLNTKKEGKIELDGIDRIFDWEPFYDQILSREKQIQLYSELRYSSFKFDLLKFENRHYFNITLQNNKKEILENYIVDMGGKVKFKYMFNASEGLLSIKDDKLYAGFTSAKEEIFIREYKLDKSIKKYLE